MKVYIYERGQSEIARLCEAALIENGFEVADNPGGCDLGVAPWLNTLIPDSELSEYKIGVLVFHPSLLPMYRGKNAIKDAFYNGDSYTGVTWFWAASGYDKGDICEQSTVSIGSGAPRDFYESRAIPVGVELLRLALVDIKAGVIRRRPQSISLIRSETVINAS